MYSKSQLKSLELIKSLLADADKDSVISEIEAIKIDDSISVRNYFDNFRTTFYQDFSKDFSSESSILVSNKAKIENFETESRLSNLIDESILKSYINFSTIRIEETIIFDKILIESDFSNIFDNSDDSKSVKESGNTSYAMAA